MRISIKTKVTTLFLGFLFASGLELLAQSSEEQNGIHVRGGSSSEALVSSNVGDTCFATGYTRIVFVCFRKQESSLPI